jgi:hypothetical protein
MRITTSLAALRALADWGTGVVYRIQSAGG